MKSTTHRKSHLAVAGLIAVLTVHGAVLAQTLPKEGRFDITACWSSVTNPMVFSKTHSAFTYEMAGTIMSNPPGGMFDNSSFRCLGIATTFDGNTGGSNVCEAIDRDGDKRMSRFSIASDGSVSRDTIAGTGKYEGIVQTTTVMPLGPFPVAKPGTSQSCNRQTGTYKLK